MLKLSNQVIQKMALIDKKNIFLYSYILENVFCEIVYVNLTFFLRFQIFGIFKKKKQNSENLSYTGGIEFQLLLSII